MYLKTMISISLAALTFALIAAPNPDFRVFLQFLISASAALIVLHTVRGETEYLWAGMFLAVVLLFNPIIPVALPSRGVFLLDLACAGLFLLYYRIHRAKPRMSIASITSDGPGSRAL